MSCAARSTYGPLWPKPVIDAQTSRGWRAQSAAASTPSRRAVRGRKLSTTTSARAISGVEHRRRVGPDRRSSVTLRLLRLSDLEIDAACRFASGGIVPRVIAAARILDLDHVRAEVGEQQRRVSARQQARQIEDAHAV